MSEKAEKTSTIKMGTAIGVAFLAVVTLNYGAVQNGYDPFAWCYGKEIVRAMSLEAWWSASVFCLVIISFVLGMWKGLMKALPFLLTACLLIAIPDWLEQGMRLGGTCH